MEGKEDTHEKTRLVRLIAAKREIFDEHENGKKRK